jgi:hypothetical protein
MSFEAGELSGRSRMSVGIDRLESVYLKVLRVAILLLATLMLIGALCLAAYSLYKISRSPESVVEQTAEVQAAEIVDAAQVAQASVQQGGTARVDPRYRTYYDQFVANYHRLFRNRFEPFRQREDKQLSLSEFGDSYIRPADRIAAIQKRELNFDEDKAALEGLLRAMTAAADHPTTQQRLKRYQKAKKVQVCETVQRTRTVTESGWDRYSTSCSGWYVEPMGCPVTRVVEKPYSSKQCSMRFPENTQSHAQIFRAFQDKYLSLLEERKAANAADAENRRAEIIAGKEEGAGQLMFALQVVGAFLVLMFFFLLIAIERHLRRRAALAADPA